MALVALSMALLFASCDHNRPNEPKLRVADNAEGLTPTHTIAQLKALYTGGPYTITEPVIVAGVMSSDDTEGNLYRTAYMQDETGGIELKLSLGNLSTLYPQGARVILKAQGMTLGAYANHVNLGYRSTDSRYETSFYPELLVPKVLHFSSPGTLQPETLTISQITPAHIGKLVRLQGVQFLASELGQTWANAENKETQANVNRTLQDRSGATIIVRTSSYARFAGRTIPAGSGAITAVVTYFRTTPQLLLLRERDAELTEGRF